MKPQSRRDGWLKPITLSILPFQVISRDVPLVGVIDVVFIATH